jgi:hypothetical protein
LIIQYGLLGNNFQNKFNVFIKNNEIKFIFSVFIFVSIFAFVNLPNDVIYFLDDETTKTLAHIEGNNVNIHNPNIVLPNSLGKAISSLGIGGTIAAGISTTGTFMKSGAPLGVKIGITTIGGVVGGGLFIAGNYINTVVQEKAKPIYSKNSTASSEIFSTKSAFEGNDNDSSLDAVIGLFNINFILNICILYLLIALAILVVSNYAVENKLSLTFIKNIFGSRFHSFIVKLLTITSKSNKI